MAQEEFEHAVKRDVEARVREGVKAILQAVLEEGIAEYTSRPATESLLPPAAASATAATLVTSSPPQVR